MIIRFIQSVLASIIREYTRDILCHISFSDKKIIDAVSQLIITFVSPIHYIGFYQISGYYVVIQELFTIN